MAEQVQVVFVTTDPATDTPEVLGSYLDNFDADLPVSFVGLTGELDAVVQAQLAQFRASGLSGALDRKSVV